MITPKNTSPPKIKSKEDAKRFRELLKERKYNLKKKFKDDKDSGGYFILKYAGKILIR